MTPEISLKKNWLHRNSNLLTIGIVAGLLFAFFRALGTIGPQAYRFLLPAGFILMMLIPFIFMDKEGRRRIGLTKSNSLNHYWLAIITGAALSLMCFGAGLFFFGTSADNWYVTIKNSYLNTFDTTGMPVIRLFIIFTIPALIFSPIGEEIFFRGFLQEALSTKLSYNKAMVIDSLFFALVHLFHHGFVKDTAGNIHFYALSGFIWVLFMFITAMAFAWLKKRSGSLLPAIVAHMIFNLVMNVCIFYAM